jgi:hypothetical protein
MEKMDQDLSLGFITKCKDEDKIDWDSITHYQQLSEKFMNNSNGTCYDKNDQQLHEEFIKKCKDEDKIDWDWVSYAQTLSEEFINYKNKINKS